MAAPRVLASTTSHKRESLVPTLDVFGRLGLRDLDLNLHHVIEERVPVAAVAGAVAANGLQIRAASGGWCDFYKSPPEIDATFDSVARQVEICRTLGVGLLRLFFGRLARRDFTPAAFAAIAGNLSRLSAAHPDVIFVFENHDGASLDPGVCADVLARVGRPNIRMNFDPINFAKAGVDPMAALDLVRPFVSHVHLKGLLDGEYCEFGEGDVDLSPVLRSLRDGGYGGMFTVEYEGPFDGTLRLYQSHQRALAALAADGVF
jgi:sugar phosphate isomerase/epimerase